MSKLWLTAVAVMNCCAALCQQTTNDNLSASSREERLPYFLNFSVNARNGAAVLKWTTSSVKAGDYFIVEKSTDSIHFETLGAIGGSANTDSTFFTMDNAVGNSIIYYRVRITGSRGNMVYSKTVSTSFEQTSDFRFYPNPVDKLLIIRTSHPLAIQVMDGYGIVWFNQDVEAGMQIINVSTLQKGNYIIKATDKETNMVISEQLIKS